LRIIAGQFRGRQLKSPPSLETRPTSDRLRETLFNIIAPQVRAARFLDLCAGSGAVGIEALSRAAGHVTFVDRSRKMRELIQANLDLCRVNSDQVKVMTAEALEFLRRAVKRTGGAWDIVFFDPPYQGDYLSVLEVFGNSSAAFLSADGVLVVEHHHKTNLPDVIGAISRRRVLKQGESALSFYRAGNNEMESRAQ
jgi:16S rRNA (guanine966-N2)-methyltransferase